MADFEKVSFTKINAAQINLHFRVLKFIDLDNLQNKSLEQKLSCDSRS